jgi:hypothetical protein
LVNRWRFLALNNWLKKKALFPPVSANGFLCCCDHDCTTPRTRARTPSRPQPSPRPAPARPPDGALSIRHLRRRRRHLRRRRRRRRRHGAWSARRDGAAGSVCRAAAAAESENCRTEPARGWSGVLLIVLSSGTTEQAAGGRRQAAGRLIVLSPRRPPRTQTPDMNVATWMMTMTMMAGVVASRSCCCPQTG